MIEHLTKAIELKSYMGFNKKYGGKSNVHLMEVCFNNYGRFIRLSEFTSNRKSTFLVIFREGQGIGANKKYVVFNVGVLFSNIDEKGRQCREERFNHKHVGHLYLSFANVVREKESRR